MRQEMLAKIDEKDPKKRAKARAEVESIIDEEYAKGPKWLDDQALVSLQIAVVQLELQARRIQELSKSRPKTTKDVAARRAVIRANASLTASRMCAMLDAEEITLPTQEQWDDFRSHPNPWTEAYRKGGKKLCSCIRVIISKDKKA